MLVPGSPVLSCYVGYDYFDTWTFWANKAQTTPYDFTGWTDFSLTIGTIVLTETNSGLVVVRDAGTVSPSIARTQTGGQIPGSVGYSLTAIDADSKLGTLLDGEFDWLQPSAGATGP